LSGLRQKTTKSKKYLLILQGFSRAHVKSSNMRANFLGSSFSVPIIVFGTAYAEVVFSNYQTTTNQL